MAEEADQMELRRRLDMRNLRPMRDSRIGRP